MSTITTHVLDGALGRPAAGVPVTLERQTGDDAWTVLGRGVTDAEGRLRTLLREGTALAAGVYRLTFDTQLYFAAQKLEGFYPYVRIIFTVRDPAQHYHVPLLLSPHGYTTYRGS